MQMNVDQEMLIEGSAARAAFVADLKTELAASLGLSPDEIEIAGLHTLAGGGRRRLQASVPVEVDVVLIAADTGAALQELDRQLTDPTSALRTGAVTGNIDPTVRPSFVFVCPVGMVKGAGDTECSPCSTYTEIPNKAGTACVPCPTNQMSGGDGSVCVCKDGFYNLTFVQPKCYTGDVPKSIAIAIFPSERAMLECVPCTGMECVSDCDAIGVTVAEGWSPVETAEVTLPILQCKAGSRACPSRQYPRPLATCPQRVECVPMDLY
jgi:hypothetical protein